MNLTAISTQLENYENKCVAIDESQEKIVGVGNDAFEATHDAERTVIRMRFCSKCNP